MDYRELAEKWLKAETSLEEEQLLREHCDEPSSAEERAVGAIISHNTLQRKQSVEVKMRSSKPYWAVASALSACCIALILLFSLKGGTTPATLATEPNVYCYVNGQEITSESEARLYAQQVMNSMQSENLAQADILGNLFTLE